jgi:hypothetical protein
MQDDIFKLLSLPRLPGRLSADQAAPVLGFSMHDIPVLVRANLLRPLGNAPANATKYFAASEIEELAKNLQWLHRATKAIYSHWAMQNRTRRNRPRVNDSQQVVTS